VRNAARELAKHRESGQADLQGFCTGGGRNYSRSTADGPPRLQPLDGYGVRGPMKASMAAHAALSRSLAVVGTAALQALLILLALLGTRRLLRRLLMSGEPRSSLRTSMPCHNAPCHNGWMPRVPRITPATISEITRRDILDTISIEKTDWSGRLEEPAFLERLWDLGAIPSTDGRFSDAAGDIWQHRVNNPEDWPDDWVFTDSRFDLMHGDDETFLRFLCEMVHPVVRPDVAEARRLVDLFNQNLAGDGWALVATEHVSGRPIFEGRSRKGVKTPATALRLPEYQRLVDPQVFEDHLRRIDAGLSSDPAAAIASSKELVESVCKVILDDYDIEYDRKDDLLDLYKATAKALKLNAESVPNSAKGSQAAQGALRALATTVQRLAELRNELGLGHGRNRASGALTRHARLTFTAASAVSEFMLDTWHERPGSSVGRPSEARS